LDGWTLHRDSGGIMDRRILSGYVLGTLGVLIFGLTLPMTRLAVSELAPWFVTMGRAALAGVIAGAVLAIARPRRPSSRELALMTLASLCLVIGFPGFVALAMTRVPAAHGGVILGVLPLATAAMAVLINGEKPAASFWFWSVLGATIVTLFALREGGGSFGLGDIFLALAVASTAVGYTISARLSGKRPGWEVISWQVIIALPLTLPVALWLAPPDVGTIRATVWGGFLYVAIFSQYLGFFAWNAGLAMGGVARVAQVQLLQTFVTLAGAALVLGEPLGIEALGTAVIVVGIVMLGARSRVSKPKG
jgi:drug/metabolite transporter (DMT)-like permease